jgi:hypothetical protein
MSQKQVFDYATQSSQTNGLKPVLAAALSSLEVQLDQELIRYRRTRPVSKAVVPGRVGNSMPNSTQNFAAIAKVVTPFPTTAPAATPTTEIKTTQEIPSLQPQETEDLFSVGAIKTEELQKVLNSESSTIYGSETEISPNAAGVNIPGVNIPGVHVPDGNGSTSSNDSSTSGSSSLVKAFQGAKNREVNVETENIATEPSDYLESSEALLRSLTEEQPQTTKRSKSNNSLLSPLGIGSMLLVLVACSAFGFALVSPKNIPLFGFGGSSSGNSEQKAQDNQTKTTASNASSNTSSNTSGQIQPTPIAKYPNLANEQFPEVNSANDVVGLKPKEKPAPTPTTAATALQNPAVQNPVVQNPVASVPMQPVQSMQPIPQTAPVPVVPPLTAPNAATANPTTTTATTPGIAATPIPTKAPPKLEAKVEQSDGWYRLSIANQGPEALAEAKKAVPGAYVSDDGKLIYLGAFKTERQATQALKELEAQGIKAKAN